MCRRDWRRCNQRTLSPGAKKESQTTKQPSNQASQPASKQAHQGDSGIHADIHTRMAACSGWCTTVWHAQDNVGAVRACEVCARVCWRCSWHSPQGGGVPGKGVPGRQPTRHTKARLTRQTHRRTGTRALNGGRKPPHAIVSLAYAAGCRAQAVGGITGWRQRNAAACGAPPPPHTHTAHMRCTQCAR
jgi:hypothetical protein